MFRLNVLLIGPLVLAQISDDNPKFISDAKEPTLTQYEENFAEDSEFPAHKRVGVKADGKLDGDIKLLDVQNRLIAILPHMNGLAHGTIITYYPNGKVYAEMDMVENKLHGEFKRYYPDGKLMQRQIHQEGVGSGPYVMYYSNGNVQSDTMVIDDNFVEEKIYSASGVLLRHLVNINKLRGDVAYAVPNADREVEESEQEMEFSSLTLPQIWSKGIDKLK
jgi:antitoxin component YwqK of YwqJK toxin-antitoxin module